MAQQKPVGLNDPVKSGQWVVWARLLLLLPKCVSLTLPASDYAHAPGSDPLQNLGCSWILTEDVAAQTISSGVAYLWPSVSEARCGGLFPASWSPGKELQMGLFLA